MECLVLVKFKTLPYNRRYIKLVLWASEEKPTVFQRQGALVLLVQLAGS